MGCEPVKGINTIIGENVEFGENVIIRNNCIIEDNVVIGDNVYIDHNCIIRSNVSIGNNSTIGANSILGEYQMDFYLDRGYHEHLTTIGANAVIRSNTIVYNDVKIGENFQSGHHVTIREKSQIGNNVSAGTLTDIQGHCEIGNFVRMHSNVFVPSGTIIEDCVWLFPHVVLTNDPTPPSNTERGAHIHSFAIIAAGATILPGVEIGSDAVVGAGAVVSKNVDRYQLVVGNPGKVIGDVRNTRNRDTGEPHYPWRYHFNRAMPWNNYGFDNWFSTLDQETQKILLG